MEVCSCIHLKCLRILPGRTKPCRMRGGNKKTCLFPSRISCETPKTQYGILRHLRWMQEQTSYKAFVACVCHPTNSATGRIHCFTCSQSCGARSFCAPCLPPPPRCRPTGQPPCSPAMPGQRRLFLCFVLFCFVWVVVMPTRLSGHSSVLFWGATNDCVEVKQASKRTPMT